MRIGCRWCGSIMTRWNASKSAFLPKRCILPTDQFNTMIHLSTRCFSRCSWHGQETYQKAVTHVNTSCVPVSVPSTPRDTPLLAGSVGLDLAGELVEGLFQTQESPIQVIQSRLSWPGSCASHVVGRRTAATIVRSPRGTRVPGRLIHVPWRRLDDWKEPLVHFV